MCMLALDIYYQEIIRPPIVWQNFSSLQWILEAALPPVKKGTQTMLHKTVFLLKPFFQTKFNICLIYLFLSNLFNEIKTMGDTFAVRDLRPYIIMTVYINYCKFTCLKRVH